MGEGVRASGWTGRAVFITTKFNRGWRIPRRCPGGCQASARRLGVDYVDLLLIHWPNPAQDRYVEAFQGLARLLADGSVRAIGTSNFKPAHLQRLFDAGLVPEVNQIQLDPRHTRSDLVEMHREHGIVTESWSPLGRGGDLLSEPAVQSLAEKYGKTPAQVVLRWHTQLGHVPIPKSAHPERLAENFAIFDFMMEAAELDQLSALDRGTQDIADADAFGH